MKVYLTEKLHSSLLLKCLYTGVMVLMSSLLVSFALEVFIRNAGLLSSGFTGLAILINMMAGKVGVSINLSLLLILLNAPVALLCVKGISLKFTIFSCIQVILTSLFLQYLHFPPLFDDCILNAMIGGVVYGLGVVLALKGNASTGGTDFIALFVSNKLCKGIWNYVFIFNCVLLCIFGANFGWEAAAYSIICQFVSTKTIESLYHRYERSTLQITTSMPDDVVKKYVAKYRHGLTVWQGYGGYSKHKYYMINTVVSSYEINEAVNLIKSVDSGAIISVYKTENFFGGFYQRPLD